MDSTFKSRLQAAFRAATERRQVREHLRGEQRHRVLRRRRSGLVQHQPRVSPPNGVHNEINTRAELEEYDPGLYEILAEVLPDEPGYRDCYYYEYDQANLTMHVPLSWSDPERGVAELLGGSTRADVSDGCPL